MGFFSDGFLGGLVEGVLGDAIGGAVNGGINSAFAQKQAEMQAKLQRENWEYAQKNAHQFEVQDLRAAGLNPVLSATNSQALGMPGSPSGNIDTSSNVNSAIAAKRQYQIAKMNADTENRNARTKELEQETNKMNADNNRRLIEALIPFHNANTGKILADTSKTYQDISNSIKLTNAQVEQLRSGTALNYKQIDEITQRIKESVERSNLTYWQKQLIITDLSSKVRIVSQMRAEEQIKYLTDDQLGLGSLTAQLGAGIFWGINPSAFGVSSSGNSGVRF